MHDQLWWLEASEDDGADPVVLSWPNVHGKLAYAIFTTDVAASHGERASRAHESGRRVTKQRVPTSVVAAFIHSWPTAKFAIDPRGYRDFKELSGRETLAALRSGGFRWRPPDEGGPSV